jgi:hypothetical protein
VLSDLMGKRYRVAGLSWRYRRRSYESDHSLSPVFKSFTRNQLKGTAAYGAFNYAVDRFEPLAAEFAFRLLRGQTTVSRRLLGRCCGAERKPSINLPCCPLFVFSMTALR